MKLGFITDYSEERVAFAAKAGFDCLEISCEKGSTIDFDVIDESGIKRIVDNLSKNGISAATIQCAPNHLTADKAEREQNNQYFSKAIKAAKLFGTNIVMTNAWADRSLTPEQNLDGFEEVFSRYVMEAEKEGVFIALENCPHWGGYPAAVGNICFSPEMWEEIFNRIPSKHLGLEFDPSHLLWQGIDYIGALKKWAGRVLAVHAKDTEIMKDKLAQCGIIGGQLRKKNDWESGWWRYRIPGMGAVDWRAIFSVLYEAGFDGAMVIEHEDPVFEGTRRDEGLLLGLKYLRQFLV